MLRYENQNRTIGEVVALKDRYQQAVDIRNDTDSCWLWKGKHRKLRQYPGFKINGKSILVHRWAYEHFVGPIPRGLLVDHLCNNNNCSNPWHLEPKTSQANTLRGETPARKNAEKTHCVNGHPFDETNTLYEHMRGTGKIYRQCRTCTRIRSIIRKRRYRERLRERKLAA